MMKHSLAILLALCFGAAPLAASNSKGRFQNRFARVAGDRYRAGELLVKFKRNEDSNSTLLLSQYGAKAARKLDEHGLTHVIIRSGQTVEQAAAELSLNPDVEYAHPNYVRQLTALPNDPFFAAQWGMKNSLQTLSNASLAAIGANTNGNTYQSSNNPPATAKDMDLQAAWDLQTDCSSVIVAVIDTGVNYLHEDLAANMWTSTGYPNHGWDFLDNDNDPMDPMITSEGHGTHVAGIIGAVGNNGVGIAGMCWNAQIMALRAGDGDGLTTAAIVSSVNFAVAHGAKVINMSYGSSSVSAAETAAYANAAASGVLLVAAAGNGDANGNGVNNDSTPFYPCNTTGVLCVAALDQGYALSSFSNYGATSVHVAAPGQNIISLANATFALYAGEASGTPDPLTGWTLTNQWGQLDSAGTNNINSLALPSNYDGVVTYATATDSRAYRNFNLAGFSDAVMQVNASINSLANSDYLYFGVSASGGEPFSTNGNFGLLGYSGVIADTTYTIPMKTCLTAACTFGLAFVVNGSTPGHGVLFHDAYVLTATASTNYYRVMSGTSMATPYVAGLAALVWSYNSEYTLSDVITAIEQGGVTQAALAGKVSSGKSVSASGSLLYIAPPSSVSASVH